MEHTDITRRYFEWLCHRVANIRVDRHKSFKRTMWHLFNTEFTWSIPLDKNRASDGIALRRDFGTHMYGDEGMANSIPGPCTVLEMMIALAIRCEYDYTECNTTNINPSRWFLPMLESMGLDVCDDNHYDEEYVTKCVNRMLTRNYQYDGSGGLFHIPDCDCDMRTIEIWSQLMKFVYLNT